MRGWMFLILQGNPGTTLEAKFCQADPAHAQIEIFFLEPVVGMAST